MKLNKDRVISPELWGRGSPEIEPPLKNKLMPPNWFMLDNLISVIYLTAQIALRTEYVHTRATEYLHTHAWGKGDKHALIPLIPTLDKV